MGWSRAWLENSSPLSSAGRRAPPPPLPPRPPQDGWAHCRACGGREMVQDSKAWPLAGALLPARGQTVSGSEGERCGVRSAGICLGWACGPARWSFLEDAACLTLLLPRGAQAATPGPVVRTHVESEVAVWTALRAHPWGRPSQAGWKRASCPGSRSRFPRLHSAWLPAEASPGPSAPPGDGVLSQERPEPARESEPEPGVWTVSVY